MFYLYLHGYCGRIFLFSLFPTFSGRYKYFWLFSCKCFLPFLTTYRPLHLELLRLIESRKPPFFSSLSLSRPASSFSSSFLFHIFSCGCIEQCDWHSSCHKSTCKVERFLLWHSVFCAECSFVSSMT